MRCPRLPIALPLLAALAGAASGCGQENFSPTGPDSAPVAAVAAATAARLVFVRISAGKDHSCGTTTDGRAWCWGSNELGQLGVPLARSTECSPPTPCSTRPLAVGGALRFRHVVAGWQFTCGVTTSDRVFCWGANGVGQLGRGSTAAFSPTPAPVADNRRYRQVRAGFDAACAITMARTAVCWGNNDAGQLGNGSATPSWIPVRVALEASWAQLTMGVVYGCGIITTGAQVRCWGNNTSGQFGNGTFSSQFTPGPGGGGLGFAQIEAGFSHTCGVVPDGRAFCWGAGFGVGDGSPEANHPDPTPVAGTQNWANVTAGSLFSCGVTRAGRGFCWGSGAGGQLGNGTNLNRFKPAAVAGSLSFAAISAGSGHACGVATNGQGWCWGDNFHGQLGDGSLVTKMAPAPVLAPAS